MSAHRPKTNDLLTQREYADRVGVDNSYVSRRTKNGGLIDGTYRPRLDARWENNDPEDGDLLGYTEPTPRPNSNGEASPESARKAAGVSSTGGNPQSSMGDRENGRPRKNSSGRSRPTGQIQNGGRSREGSGLEQALKKAGETAGAQAARSPGILRGLLRLGGAALGAILAAELVGRQAGPVLLGTVIGFGVTEYAVRAEQTHPQEPTRQIRSTGLRLPSRPNLPPGMNQVGDGQKQRGQFMVEKERLARERPVGT
jgi:hypothetical protein